MDSFSVSLDLESVLADINTPFVEEYNERNNADIDGEWESWGFDDCEFSFDEFMRVTTHNWKHSPHEIPTCEPELSLRVFNLYQQVDQLDIVTGRIGVDEKLQAWLDTKGIMYDNFVVRGTNESKADLDYNIYIDDNPRLVPEVEPPEKIFLVDQPYNRHMDGQSNLIRVDELPEVTHYLENHW